MRWVWVRPAASSWPPAETDMRLGFNGLYALVVGQLKEDPPERSPVFVPLTNEEIG